MKKVNILLAFVMTVLSAHASADSMLDNVKSSGVLKVGLEGTYPPFGFLDKSNNLVGFDVDVANALASQMGVKAQFVTGEFSGLIGGLQAEKFNIVANQIEITPKRKAALFLTQPYAYSALQLILREKDDSHYTSLNDMKGKSLAITLGSNYGEYAKKYPGVVVKTYPSSAEYIRDLVQGRVNAAINDRLYIPYLIKNSALPVKPGALLKNYVVEIGIAAKKGNPDFTHALENAMENIQSNGTLTKISVKWFGTDVSQPLK